MAINNITQTISTLPPAGRRGVDVQTQFVIKQEDFQDHLQGTTVTELNTLKDQLNSRIGEINSTTTTMNGYANTASAGASTATTKAGEASTSATTAETYKNQAETFKNNAATSATKASQWADNNYNVEVETGRYSAKHWSTVAQNTLGTKVDKVTSTDNAIPKFNGTTGDIQNSGVIIDDNNNVGIGVTPSAWRNTHKSIDIGAIGSIVGDSGSVSIASNSYLNTSSNMVYKQSGIPAMLTEQYNGATMWYTAPSGTAGQPITWTTAMTLDASGVLTVQNLNSTQNFSKRIVIGDSTGAKPSHKNFIEAGSTSWGDNGYMAFGIQNTEKMRIDSNGVLNVNSNPTNGRINIGASSNYIYGDTSGNLILGSGGADMVNVTANGILVGSDNTNQKCIGINHETGVIQSYNFNVTMNVPLKLNPASGGGNVLIGSETDNGVDKLQVNGSVSANGNLLLTSATGALGYGTGSGGIVTQLTNKSTSVTLNKPSGRIIMHSATLGIGASVSFIVNNSVFSTQDTVVLSGKAWSSFYQIENANSSTGTIGIRVANVSGTSRSDPLEINFTILKGAES